jgi:membrane-associated phospholipid phosphatase
MALAALAGAVALAGCADPVAVPETRHTAALLQKSGDPFTGRLASLGWQELARSLVVKYRFIPPAASHLYAYHSVADYAAVVAVGQKFDDSDPVPGKGDGFGRGGRRRYEAERGAVAGASAATLTYFFPLEAAALEQRVRDEADAGPGERHPYFAIGEQVGREMAQILIARAKTDGFDAKWSGTVPEGEGLWKNAPAPAQPLGPLYGSMRPWFLESGSQFRPPAPPAFGSDAFVKALQEVRFFSDTRTDAQLGIALKWAHATGTPGTTGFWTALAGKLIDERGLTERAATHLLAVLNASAMDAMIACWDAKYFYWFIRPSQADPGIKLIKEIAPPSGLPNHPSYPSGHSCASASAATVLAAFFPDKANELAAMVVEAGVSRIYAGIHYRFDIEAGAALGRAVARNSLSYDATRGLLSAIK